MRLLPTDRYMTWIPRDKAKKSVLPKNPTVHQLRNFSYDPVVRKAITIVQDALVRQSYTFDVLNGRSKQTKAITALTNMIEHPNVIDTRESFVKRLIDDAMVLDAMVVDIERSTDPNHPVYMYPVDGSTIQPLVPFSYDSPDDARYAQQQSDGMHYYTAKDIAYLQLSYFTYRATGLSPLMQCYKYVKFYLESLEQSSDKATNATSAFLLNLGEGVTEEQKNAFIEYMQNDIESTGHIPVVSAKSVQSVQLRSINKDDLYLQWTDKLTQIIGMTFGIAPERLGLSIANDRSTNDDQENIMSNDAIKPYDTMISTLYNQYLIANLGLGGVLKYRSIQVISEAQLTAKSTRLVNEYANDLITENEFRSLIGIDARSSKYADVTVTEKKAMINADIGVNGQNGFGTIKDTSDATGGDNNGKT